MVDASQCHGQEEVCLQTASILIEHAAAHYHMPLEITRSYLPIIPLKLT